MALLIESSEVNREVPWFDRIISGVLNVIPGLTGKNISNRLLLAVRGSLWTVVGYGASQLLRLATQLVLARKLLGPQAFGLVALVSVFLSGLEMLSDLGVGMDVVQHRRGDDPRFINTAFMIQAGRGLVLFSISAALAYPFASFYHQPAVRWMIVVASCSVALRGLASGSIWTLTRHVKLRQLTSLTVTSEIAGFVVSVIWAIVSPTAWALVVGKVASSATYSITSHFMGDKRVSLDWDSEAARDIFIFGTGIFLSSATYFLSGEAERLIVGKFITVAELGCFSLAITLAAAPSSALGQVVGQVFYPMIAHSVRDDRVTAARHFKRAHLVFLVAGTLIGVFFIAYGPRLVALLLPPKFAMTGWMLQLLGWRSAQQICGGPTMNIVLAHGDSKTPAISNLLRLVALAAGLFVAFSKFGLHAAVLVLTFSSALAYVVYVLALARHLRPALQTELWGILIFIGSTGAAALIPWPWR